MSKPETPIQIKNKLAKKFNLKATDFVDFPYKKGTAIVYVGETEYKGTPRKIMAQPKKEWEIRLNNKRYDTRCMTLDLYKAFMAHCNKQGMSPMPDSSGLDTWTCTWLLGDLNDDVPYGLWFDSRVLSGLSWADLDIAYVRPRLAVIILDLEPSASPDSFSSASSELAKLLEGQYKKGFNDAIDMVSGNLPSKLEG